MSAVTWKRPSSADRNFFNIKHLLFLPDRRRHGLDFKTINEIPALVEVKTPIELLCDFRIISLDED